MVTPFAASWADVDKLFWVKTFGECREQQHTKDGATDCASPADQQSSTHNHGRNSVNFVELSVCRGFCSGARERHRRSNTGGGACQHVQVNGVATHVHASQASSRRVTSDHHCAAAKHGAIQRQIQALTAQLLTLTTSKKGPATKRSSRALSTDSTNQSSRASSQDSSGGRTR